MKNKIVVGILFVIAIFIISLGCFIQFDNNLNIDGGNNGNISTNDNLTKKTVCTYESVSSGIKITDSYTFNYIDDALKSYSIVLKYEYSSETEEAALRYKGDSIKNQIEASKNVNGIDITHTDRNYVITNSYKYDLVKFDSSDSSVSSIILPAYNLNDSVSEIVKEVKGWEYNCVESTMD